MLKVIVAFVFLISITVAEDSFENSCGHLKGKSNISYFDVEKYVGKWYVTNYAINSRRTVENNGHFVQCRSLSYEFNSNKTGYQIKANNSLVPDTSEYHRFVYENCVNWTTTFDTEKSSIMEMAGQNQPGAVLGMAVLATDYDNYAIEYICMQHTYKMLRLLTRNTETPAESVNNVFNSLFSSSELCRCSIYSYPKLNCN